MDNTGGGESANNDDGGSSINSNQYLEKLTSMGASFLDTVSQTWDELIASGQAKDINKKIGNAAPSPSEGAPDYSNDDAAADKYESYKGNRDIMVIDPQEHLSAWERMERRLRDAPIISDILERSQQVYEESGAIRDIFQNHLLQLLALTAMEPPSDFSADAVRNEKVKVLRSLRPFTRVSAATDSVCPWIVPDACPARFQ